MIGGMIRHAILISLKAPPLAIGIINISGSFLLGVIAAIWSKENPWFIFFGIGLPVGYTTYSTFSIQVVEQLQK